MTEGMKKFRLAFASGVITVEFKEGLFRDRKDLGLGVWHRRVVPGVVVNRRARSREYINLGLVERIL